MKKLFLFFLFILTTCATIEESFVDNIVLEKSKEKALASLIKPQIRNTARVTTKPTIRYITRYTSGVTTRHTTKYTTGVTTKHSLKVQTTTPRKTSMKNPPIKGIDKLFTGKLREEFRKQNDSVKKVIVKLVKRNKCKSFLMNMCSIRLDPSEIHRGICENLPRKDCEQAMGFAKIALKYSK